MPSIAIERRPEILELVANGAMLKTIAQSFGITPAAISNQLHDDKEYLKAREVGAEVRLQEQFDEITSADTIADVSRAREGFRAAAWFAEREFPNRWGSKSEVKHTGGITVDHTVSTPMDAILARIAPQHERVIDITPQPGAPE